MQRLNLVTEANKENTHVKIVKKALGLTAVGGLIVAGIGFSAPSSHATVLTAGQCSNLLAIGSAKSTTVGDGVTDKDNQDVSIGSKGVDPNTNKGTTLGNCTFNSGLSTPDGAKPPVKGYNGTKAVIKWGTKLFSPEADCNTADTTDNTEWPINGTLSATFADLNGGGKNNGFTAAITITGFSDPDNNPATPSDVVDFRGLVIKGVAAGADVGGQSEFDPIVKDKTQTGATPYFGYQFNVGAAVGCADATPANANILSFMNGSVGGVSQLLGLPVSGVTMTIGT